MRRLCTIFLAVLFAGGLMAQSTLFWVNKDGGDFDEPRNWSFESGGNPGSVAPSSSLNAVFDENSTITEGAEIVFQAGIDYSVNSLIVDSDAENIVLKFNGTSSNRTTLSIYDDLFIQGDAMTSFLNAGFDNRILFDGPDDNRKIDTYGKNLNYVEFLGLSTNIIEYNLISDLYAASFIRLHGGRMDTNGQDITTDGTFLFRDSNTSSNALTKIISANGSEIRCQKFDAKLAYDFIMTGNYTVFTEIFDGSPPLFLSDPVKIYSDIVLLDYEPTHLVASFNYQCSRCKMNSVRVEDTDITKIGGGSIIENLIIENSSSIIQINGGNSLPNSIQLNSVVYNQGLGECNEMPTLEPVHTSGDFITVNKVGGGLNDVYVVRMKLIDIKAGDGNSYTLNEGLIAGATEGWTQTNPIQPREFTWTGNGSDDSWFNPDNWKESAGIMGCLPTSNDVVRIEKTSVGPIVLPANTSPQCGSLLWLKTTPMTMNMNSSLTVNGDITVDKNAGFTGTGLIILTGVGQSFINSISPLPRIEFRAIGSDYVLGTNLTCEGLIFGGVNFYTDNNDVSADYWLGQNIDGNGFYLGSSDIIINGEFDLAFNDGNDMIVEAGNSTIVCKEFDSPSHYDFHDVRLENISTFTLANWPYSFNTLDLRGSGKVRMLSDMQANKIILDDGDVELELGSGVELNVLDGIEARAAATNASPAKISSADSDNRGKIINGVGNMCLKGHIDFEDIIAEAPGVIHAPDGNDLGSNSNINFTPINSNPTILYWVGNTAEWTKRNNWSTLPGGCGTNFDMNSRDRLIFDEHGFYNQNEVLISVTSSTNNIEFTGLSQEVIFNVENGATLSANQIDVDASYVNFLGNKIIVNGPTTAEGSTIILNTFLYQSRGFSFINAPSLMVMNDQSTLDIK